MGLATVLALLLFGLPLYSPHGIFATTVAIFAPRLLVLLEVGHRIGERDEGRG